MKTPEEIKKGLELCTTVGSHCNECPYDGQCLTDRPPEVDALAYILQLENDLQYTTDAANIMKDEALKLETRLAQVERERDALLHDLRRADYVDCYACKNKNSAYDCDVDCINCLNPCTCNSCRNNNKWEWRGVCEENTKED